MALVGIILVIKGFVWGLVRILLTLVALAITAYTTWLSYGLVQGIFYPNTRLIVIASGVIGLATFVLITWLLRFVVTPFNASKTKAKVGFGISGAVLSLFAIVITLWASIVIVRYTGSMADLRSTANFLSGNPTKARDSAAIDLKQLIDQSTVGKWMSHVDPINSQDKLTMAKIMLMYHDKPMRSKMLKKPVFDSILNNHVFLKTAYLDQIKSQAESGEYNELYKNHLITKIVNEESIVDELDNVSFFHAN